MSNSGSKKSSPSRKTSKPKPSSLSKQYQDALLGETAAPEPLETPVTRLASPKLLSSSKQPPMEQVNTTPSKKVQSPSTKTKLAVDRLRAHSYEPLFELVDGNRLEAIYAASPLGEKVLIRVSDQYKHQQGDKTFIGEPAEDPVVGAEVYEFFAKEMITEKPLGKRIDTDFAVLTPFGISVWTKSGSESTSWLYNEKQEDAIANITNLRTGWFVVASISIDALHDAFVPEKTILDRLYYPPMDRETGQSIASFDILIQLLRMTGLSETLRTGGPFTLIAPTDAAFAKLSEGTARDLVMYSSREKLASILEYHVYSGKFTSKTIGDDDVATVQGETIMWDKTTNPVTANNANVQYVDLEASNGVIHVVDTVLIPKNTGSPTIEPSIEFVTMDDVDYTTQIIRMTLNKYNDRRGMSLAEGKEKVEEALVELQEARSRVSRDVNVTLIKTKQYNILSENPSSKSRALELASEISVHNDAIDANIARQNEVNALLADLESITSRIKALALTLKKNSRAASTQSKA